MTRKILFSLLVMILISLPLFTACEETTTSPDITTSPGTTSPTTAAPTATGNWWDELGTPQYGGTMNFRVWALNVDLDPYVMLGGINYAFETLFQFDWQTDRDVWSFKTMFTPQSCFTGNLAESWDWIEPNVLAIKIREGVYWQDKEPVNGRELTADDIQQHYDRILGNGSGYTEPSPYYVGWLSNVEKVTATDRYNLEVKFKTASAMGIYQIMDQSAMSWIEAPEAVKTEGGLTDWEKTAGTGPWILTDYIDGTSATWSRNLNYWGTDERYPENQLPYLDTLKVVCIPDNPTALAALRTGQIDLMDNVDWQQAQNLAKTNPDLIQASLPYEGGGYAIDLRCDTPPFTDINVRKALELAINRSEIANSYYGGTAEEIPCGDASQLLTGWVTAYEDWPQELKDEYSYNPDKAKQLLAEAGYPEGFQTNIVACSAQDLQLLQVIKDEFQDIGVEMDIEVFNDMPTYQNYCFEGKHDQMVYNSETGLTFPPNILITFHATGSPTNLTYPNDAELDAIVQRFNTAENEADAKQAFKEADMRILSQHYTIRIVPYNVFTITQPHVKGFSGETWFKSHRFYFARYWLDQN